MARERYRVVNDAYVYFVTYSIVDWLPVFVSKQACEVVTDSLNFCHQQKHLRINAFVVMPTHVHAILFDAALDNERLKKTLAEFRRFTGRSLSDHCTRRMPKCFTTALTDASTNDRKRRFWQPTRHPVALQTEQFWEQKFNYLHENPCRKGLVTRAADWRFSSAAFYVSDGRQQCDVTLSTIDWT